MNHLSEKLKARLIPAAIAVLFIAGIFTLHIHRTATDKTEITIWLPGPSHIEQYRPVFEAFEREMGKKLKDEGKLSPDEQKAALEKFKAELYD